VRRCAGQRVANGRRRSCPARHRAVGAPDSDDVEANQISRVRRAPSLPTAATECPVRIRGETLLRATAV
jgi:hypothetical protein